MWDTMTQREQDCWIAENVFKFKIDGDICENQDFPEWNGDFLHIVSEEFPKPRLPHYTSDLTAAFEVEEKIKELGKEDLYIERLLPILGIKLNNNTDYIDLFMLIHATTAQRMKAVWLAVKDAQCDLNCTIAKEQDITDPMDCLACDDEGNCGEAWNNRNDV